MDEPPPSHRVRCGGVIKTDEPAINEFFLYVADEGNIRLVSIVLATSRIPYWVKQVAMLYAAAAGHIKCMTLISSTCNVKFRPICPPMIVSFTISDETVRHPFAG